VAGGIAYGLALLIASLLGIPVGLAAIASGALAGWIAGLFQQQFLRPYLHVRPAWQWTTLIGWAIAIPLIILLTLIVRELAEPLSDGYRLTLYLIGAGLAGLAASAGQWWILRSRIAHAYRWLWANAVGWAMLWLAVLGITWLIQQESLPATVDDLALGVLLGSLAGWTLGLEQGIVMIAMFAEAIWGRHENRVE
jgi:hypothetical protein